MMLALIPMALLISGCETATFDKRAAPPIAKYTKEQQIKLADELKACNCPMLHKAMQDYGKLRDKVRVLSGERVR